MKCPACKKEVTSLPNIGTAIETGGMNVCKDCGKPVSSIGKEVYPEERPDLKVYNKTPD